MAGERATPIDVFVSYAPVDEAYWVELEKHLSTVRREGSIKEWHQGRVGAGEVRDEAVAAHLEAASVVLLLVSVDYLAADTYWEEMKRALARRNAGSAEVIPIIVRACDWRNSPFGDLVPLPRDGAPIESPVNDRAWTTVVSGIREAVGRVDERRTRSRGWAAAALVDTSAPELSPLLGLDPPPARAISLPSSRADARARSGASVESGEAAHFAIGPGRLDPAASEPGPPPNNLPLRREHFVGREREIESLHALLTEQKQASIVQGRQASIYGLGGIGKTALALEYSYRHLGSYPGGVFWIDAEGEPLDGMIQLAGVLRIISLSEVRARLHVLDPNAPADELARCIRLALQNQSQPSLLVLDNVSSSGWKELLPAGEVRVLMTTRDERAAVGRREPLLALPPADAVQLARRIAGEPGSGEEERALEQVVVDKLFGLAVAVEMAGRAVHRWAGTWARYVGYLESQQRTTLTKYEAYSDYPRSAYAALELSIGLCKPGNFERYLLGMIAFLAAELPTEGIDSARRQLWSEPSQIAVAEALATLRELGVITVDAGAQTISMHRLVQAVARGCLSEGERNRCVEMAVRLVDHEFPESGDDVETWPACARWLPHALAATGHAKVCGVAREARARLLARFAVYLQGRAAFAEAKGYLEQALALHEEAYGEGDPRVAAVLRSLGSVLHDLGDFGGARARFERALAIDVATFGPDHPHVARDVNDLGCVLMDLGDLTGARKHLERALAIDEATYGPDDPSVAIRLNNLGALFRDLGDFTSARTHLERALAIDIRAYGPDHPTVAIGRTNLGRLLHDLGDLTGAREQFEEALKIDEHTYGCYHPRFALALNNRGRVMRDLGDFAGARGDFERALAIVEATYGPDHPDVARDINNLGSLLRDLGDLEGARESFARVLRIAEATYGPDQPAIAIGCNNLGSVLQALGDLAGAREQLDRALRIAESTYGPEHPVVASIVNNLGRVLQALGDLPGAWQQIERAVAIATKALGPTHPSVQIFSGNLARVGDALGRGGGSS